MAYLRRSKRIKDETLYESWSIVESVRTARGPRQRTVATLGKAPEHDTEERLGWERIAGELSCWGRPRAAETPGLFDCAKDETGDAPLWATVDLKRVRVERVRRFGDVYLALGLWRRLRLDEFFERHIEKGREEVAWSVMACLHGVARLVAPSSDLAIAESLYEKTALEDLLGVADEQVNDDRLYRALDAMLPAREALFEHLRELWGEFFGASFDVLLYDVTSTYFEGEAKSNALAARGYSRDSRPDCPQVTIGLVVTPDQLPLAYEVFEGNRPDTATLEDIFNLMETRYGKARRVWVLDRGFVSDLNLAQLRRRGALYLVGTPRSALKKVERELLEKNWDEVAPGVEAKIVKLPPGRDEKGEPDPGAEETYLLCRSTARIEKDKAIVDRAKERLNKDLERLTKTINSGRLRDRSKADRRLGRLLEKHSRAGRLFEVAIEEIDDENKPGRRRLNMKVTRQKDAADWTGLQNGCYLLRTNLLGKSAKEMWKTYIGLTEAEAAFRALKSPLGMRPVFHRKTDRVLGHIFVCFLALAMRRALSMWMQAAGLGTAPDKLLKQFGAIHSMDIVLTGPRQTVLRLRVVGTPDEPTRVLLYKLGLRLPNRAKLLSPCQNVVATFAPPDAQPQ